MNHTAANPYLRTKVLTAGPEQLRLMLYEGAIKFCRQGRHALGQNDFESMYHALTRAQKIVLELSTSINHDTDRELCDRIAALYDYLYRRLIDANMERDGAAIDECIRLLEYERETWLMLIRRLGEDGRSGEAEAENIPIPAAPRPRPRRNMPAGITPDEGGFSTQG